MSNAEIYIVVEGQTEQTFIRDVPAPLMGNNGFFLYPALTGRPGHKGGNNFERAKKDIDCFLKQREDIYVSTMFDYFRIDPDWPGKSEVSRRIENGRSMTSCQRAVILENATANIINAGNRFIPYIEMHEFEALLFSDANILAEKLQTDKTNIDEILDEYSNPEEINDDPAKAPSKRLKTLKNGYRKVAEGKTISEAIGIQKMRQQCPHFNSWLTRLEDLCPVTV